MSQKNKPEHGARVRKAAEAAAYTPPSKPQCLLQIVLFLLECLLPGFLGMLLASEGYIRVRRPQEGLRHQTPSPKFQALHLSVYFSYASNQQPLESQFLFKIRLALLELFLFRRVLFLCQRIQFRFAVFFAPHSLRYCRLCASSSSLLLSEVTCAVLIASSGTVVQASRYPGRLKANS